MIGLGPLAIVRGGGELGTGAAHALHGAGLAVVVLDLPLPRMLRQGVAFATAAVTGRIAVSGVVAVHCADRAAALLAVAAGEVAVWTDEERALGLAPALLVDARMRQLTLPLTRIGDAPVVVGIGPGFVVGQDCHYIVESNRGPALGQLLTAGRAEAHTGIPGESYGHAEARVLRAPCAGVLARALAPGDWVEIGDVVARVGAMPVTSRLAGMVRGLKLAGVPVGNGHKVGDVDPRRDRTLLTTLSDKALAVGQGVLAAARRAGVAVPAPAREPLPPGRLSS